MIILLREGDELVVAATAAVPGGLDPEVRGSSPFERKRPPRAILLGKFTGVDLGARESGRALIAPLLFRGHSLGVVVALDQVGEAGRFDDEDELLLDSFAASAASAIGTARAAERESLRLARGLGAGAAPLGTRAPRRDAAAARRAEADERVPALRPRTPETARKTLVRAASQLEQSIASSRS